MEALSITYRSTAELVPYAGNARTHPEEQIEQLCENIRKFGFYNPVLVDQHGTIIAGHGRIMAANLMGLDRVPTIEIEGLSDEERRALVLADNKIAQNASWDFAKVRDELSALAIADFDLKLTGFGDNEINALLESTADILPSQAEAFFVDTVEPKQRELPKENPNAELERVPSVSDDLYSRFDIVMLHTNKAELVEVLNQRRTEMMYDKLEDALMDLVKCWKENR